MVTGPSTEPSAEYIYGSVEGPVTRDELICSAYEGGKIIPDLCAEYGLSKSRISTILKNNGVVTRRRLVDRAMALELYASGKSAVEVAKALGCDRSPISNLVRKAGVTRQIREQIATHSIDAGYFASIDTEPKAYWFGFCLADGCLVRRHYRKSGRRERVFVVGLAERDKKHLYRLRETLRSSHPVRTRQRPDGRLAAVLSITCAELARGLLGNGWDEYKVTGKWPTIPAALERHLVRGLIDGDGWVSHADGRPEVGLCSEHREPLTQSLRVLGITANLLVARSKRSKKDIWKWRKKGSELIPVHNTLYSDATIWLPRKRTYLESML